MLLAPVVFGSTRHQVPIQVFFVALTVDRIRVFARKFPVSGCRALLRGGLFVEVPRLFLVVVVVVVVLVADLVVVGVGGSTVRGGVVGMYWFVGSFFWVVVRGLVVSLFLRVVF